MKIRFGSGTSLPMYGNSVDELTLEIDGQLYKVVELDGKPALVKIES